MHMVSTARTLDTAVCVCGHWFDDHKVLSFGYTTQTYFNLGECLDTTCVCSNYRRDVLIGQLS